MGEQEETLQVQGWQEREANPGKEESAGAVSWGLALAEAEAEAEVMRH